MNVKSSRPRPVGGQISRTTYRSSSVGRNAPEPLTE